MDSIDLWALKKNVRRRRRISRREAIRAARVKVTVDRVLDRKTPTWVLKLAEERTGWMDK